MRGHIYIHIYICKSQALIDMYACMRRKATTYLYNSAAREVYFCSVYIGEVGRKEGRGARHIRLDNQSSTIIIAAQSSSC